jgi:hypothetical protein
LRLLWIATKSPWPPVDGGRLLLLESLKALAGSGVRATLIAPVDESARSETAVALAPWCEPRLVVAARRSRLAAAARSVASGKAWSVARHESRPIREAVAREIAAARPDVVVAEQLQAFAQSAPAAVAGVPRILRAQNVECDLWRQLAGLTSAPKRLLFAREARRLAVAERRAVAAADATVALSGLDGSRLVELGASGLRRPRVDVVAPPCPAGWPAAPERLAGEPALVLFGSAGWEPNARAGRHFLEAIWPALRAALPGACLHLFGGEGRGGAGVVRRPAPRDARDAFAPGALFVLPLDLASGVRMRILEAWSRGVAVLATPAAASGLRFAPGEELLLAGTPEETIREVRRFRDERGLGERLVAAGRARLVEDHDPGRFAKRFLELANELVSAPDSR